MQAWFDGTFGFGGGRVKVDFVRDEVGALSCPGVQELMVKAPGQEANEAV